MKDRMPIQTAYSENKKRNLQYIQFLESCKKKTATVLDIIYLGHTLMRKEKLHHHFFQNSLLETARYLTFFSLNLPYEVGSLLGTDDKITEEDALKVIHLFERRIAEKIPVEYLTHLAFYLGNTFYVNEHVLVPRSIMNTRFNDFLMGVRWKNHRVLDLCTGSGCIGITLALLNPTIQVDLVDISIEALAVANINIKRYSLEDRVRCIQSDLFENIHETYDLIISNPPYVTTSEYEKSPAEFKKEPKIALESGKTGLDILEKMISQAKAYLNPQGKLIAEVGVTAAKRLKKMYPKIVFKWFKYKNPAGKVSIFALDCIFECEAKNLP